MGRLRRKKVPVSDRQPLGRPQTANHVWSMDFVFDRTAEGRVIKCLTVVYDATHEAVAIVPERAIGAQPLTRILDHWQSIADCRKQSGPITARSLPDRAWQAEPECLYRIVQRTLAG